MRDYYSKIEVFVRKYRLLKSGNVRVHLGKIKQCTLEINP